MTAPLGTLGRYTLLRRLAAGGMGEVYLAEVQGAANFTRRVAIKRILPHLARDEAFVTKFIDEANLMVRLHHGNIVPIQELADHDGELYLVMEYLPGRDLKAVNHRLRATGRRMPVDIAVWLLTEVCAGLDYAHRRTGDDGHPLQLVHRDVSPSNVVLGAGGEVKLVDFGIARARGTLHRSISGTLQGKFVYMSPEQADGRAVDARSDIFSAGLVLYELICGVRPFEGESETETLRLVRQAEVVPPSQVRRELDPRLDELVMRALAREAADRYQTAGEMRRELLHFLADQRSAADAGALARFLAELFPEGVVPSAEPEAPLSLDDALRMQLGALTPSIDPLGRTRTGDSGRTRTGTGPLPRQAASAGRVADVTPSSGSVSRPPAADTTEPPEVRLAQPGVGRRWFLLTGLLLGAGASAAVAAWLARPDPDPQPVDRPVVVAPVATDAGVPDTAVAVVEADAAAEPDAALAVVEQPDAGAAVARAADAATAPERPRPVVHHRPRTVELVSEPAGAEVWFGGQKVGKTPFPATKAGRYQLRAGGYQAQTVEVKPGRGDAPATVTLERLPTGFLSVRATPMAAKLYLNGKRIDNPTKEAIVTAETHTLRAVFETDGLPKPVTAEKTIVVEPNRDPARAQSVVIELPVPTGDSP